MASLVFLGNRVGDTEGVAGVFGVRDGVFGGVAIASPRDTGDVTSVTSGSSPVLPPIRAGVSATFSSFCSLFEFPMEIPSSPNTFVSQFSLLSCGFNKVYSFRAASASFINNLNAPVALRTKSFDNLSQ